MFFYEEPFADALGKKEEEELDEQFFDDDAVVPSIRIASATRGYGILCTRIQEA